MLGAKGSVSTRWLELAPQMTVVHAVAHRLESAYGDACGEVAYLAFIGELCQDVYSVYNASMKQNAALHAMAAAINTEVVL